MNDGTELKEATGDNSNTFYQTGKTATPIISDKASIASLDLKETVVYDLPTQAGKTYTFIAK